MNWKRTARMTWRFLTLGIFMGLISACSNELLTQKLVEPERGASDFVSADGVQGQRTAQTPGSGYDGAATDDKQEGNSSSNQRTVEEGDIYRVLGGNLILNLNSYRGLQVIDVSNVSQPRILGKVAVSGYPVEMYVVGQQAFVLMNNWLAYYGSRSDVQVDTYDGGLVLAVDLSNPASPIITSRAQVPGSIQTSRLTRGGGKQALFVAASNWNQTSTTVVKSFAVTGDGQIQERSTIDLGGYVSAVQGTPEALLVARYNWDNQYRTTVSVIDISNADGYMVEGGEVDVAGNIKNKTNLDFQRGILRVASGNAWWGNTTANHLQTFNFTQLQNPIAVDYKTFGSGEDLYASLFLGNKAFCVTYRRVDPFHAFEISDTGLIIEKSQFVVSGWNDFFNPVISDSRLIGIGVDDQNGRRMAVSLYDISDLQNPNPLLSRAAIEFDYSWSEAQWDNRAYSVLEDAVSVAGPNGITETGLVLLPFSGYNSVDYRYTAAVQIFTFSDRSLTKRGIMEHGTQVRRSFQAKENTSANLSEAELSLFDHSDPDHPVELGRIELAPNYTDFLVFGNYGARLKYDTNYYGWWGSLPSDLPNNQLQIIPLGGDPDSAEPLAIIDLPAQARLYQVGSLAVSVVTNYVANSDPAQYQSQVQVFDLSDPIHPSLVGTLETDRIQPDYGYWGGPWGWGGIEDGAAKTDEACFNCGRGYSYGSNSAYPAGDSLVFTSRQWESELLGIEHICYTYPERNYMDGCYQSGSLQSDCTFYSGSITCRSLNGAPPTCSGEILLCTYDDQGAWNCQPVDPDSIPTQEYCYDQESRRYWSHLYLDALDLRNPVAPVMAQQLIMPQDEDDVSLIGSGTSLYLTFRAPVQLKNDGRPFVRYYFKQIDFTDPGDPQLGPAINIPGELLLVEGSIIFTRDFIWGENIVETALNKLLVVGDRAYLQARRRFVDQEVHGVRLDGAGHALVSHAISWYSSVTQNSYDYSQMVEKLSILDINGEELAVLSEVNVDNWATLQDATLGRALFQVPGGVLVINVEDAQAPYAQAFYPLLGWPSRFVSHASDIYIPSGPYGLFRFDIASFNLEPRS